MLASTTLRLAAFALGAGLHFFLAGVVLRKRRGRVENALLAALLAVGLWHASGALALFYRLGIGETGAALRVLDAGGRIFASAGIVLLLGTASLWRGGQIVTGLLAAAVGAALVAGQAAVFVALALGPPVWLAWRIYRYNLLGLSISRRVVFVIQLSLVSVVYLFAVKIVADYADRNFEVFGALIEVALVLGAAVLWLPLYGWMTRRQARRTELLLDFGKRAIDQAAGILDLRERLDFLAAEVARTFGLKRVELKIAGSEDEIERWARDRRPDVVHAERTEVPEVRAALAATGFTYLFPLRHEDELRGLMLVDASPRVFLDDDEAILAGLARQISHSIETCRLLEEKIGLERALLEQEHLASLGMVSATIAHEIKNPLSSIKTLAQLMSEDDAVRERYARDLHFIVAETDRLNSCVQQLLTFSRPAADGSPPVEFGELVESIGRVMEREAASQQVKLEQSVDPALRGRRVERQATHQIVLNLVQNAIQASGGGAVVRLEAGERPGGRVFIAVTDAGPGIPAELRDRIFEPFFTRKQKGTGLG
ncbi:MAG: two-component system sensor histidine kinase NtrB, partial [Bryobacteraceae bacterium]